MKKIRATKTGAETAIRGGVLYFEDARQCDIDEPLMADIIGDGYTKTIRVESLSKNYFERVYTGGTGMREDFVNVQMTLRREKRADRWYWYAYRRVMGKLNKRFVGEDDQICNKRLLEVAQKLPSL